MNQQTPRKFESPTVTGSRGRRMLMAGAVAAIVGTMSLAGISNAADNQPNSPNAEKHERHGGKHRGGPEQMQKRFDRMLNKLVPDASPEQKVKLGAIAKSAFGDLQPLREKGRDLHTQRSTLLAARTIDRAALEQVRQAEQQLADQRSRRMTQAFADAAEVLTPAQRVKAAEEMKKHGRGFGPGFGHGHRHGHGDGPRHHGDKGGPDHKPGNASPAEPRPNSK